MLLPVLVLASRSGADQTVRLSIAKKHDIIAKTKTKIFLVAYIAAICKAIYIRKEKFSDCKMTGHCQFQKPKVAIIKKTATAICYK